jgi:YVTN family beta-propeller protein
VLVIDTTQNKVVATVPVGSLPVDIAITPDGTKAYVGNANANTVSVIDIGTGLTTTVAVGRAPFAVTTH